MRAFLVHPLPQQIILEMYLSEVVWQGKGCRQRNRMIDPKQCVLLF